jgi:predicted metalloprotease
VYLDLSFFRELSRRFGAPGDFAAAYVIAHEIGHHIQGELGIEEQVRRTQQEDPSRANVYSVQLELQADCFAGVWARSTYDRGLLDAGDIEEGLAAAAAVGDDRLGARSREQWTHGSSELRTQWFRTGFDSGQPGDCDTSGVDL